MKTTLSELCKGYSKNIALKDLINNNGTYPIYGASGYIKNVVNNIRIVVCKKCCVMFVCSYSLESISFYNSPKSKVCIICSGK